jgi:hypothetical protein
VHLTAQLVARFWSLLQLSALLPEDASIDGLPALTLAEPAPRASAL